jgi:hypothetical protein
LRLNLPTYPPRVFDLERTRLQLIAKHEVIP